MIANHDETTGARKKDCIMIPPGIDKTVVWFCGSRKCPKTGKFLCHEAHKKAKASGHSVGHQAEEVIDDSDPSD